VTVTLNPLHHVGQPTDTLAVAQGERERLFCRGMSTSLTWSALPLLQEVCSPTM